MKSYTDLEQSKKLAEILPIESSDMEYILEQWYDEKTHRYKEGYCEIPVVKVDDDCPLQPITLPCWSLAALMELLPSELSLPDMYGGTIKYEICIRKYNHTNEQYLYQIAYATNQGLSKSWHDMVNTSEQEDLLDAVFEMVVYLKENKLM